MKKGIYIFIGPPFSGKETQTAPLSRELGLPVFSMGGLIRQARETNPEIEEAFQAYSRKGLHVPIEIKFGLLEDEMNKNPQGFILDNFPASQSDLDVFSNYLQEKGLEVEKVFYLNITHDEMIKRFNDNPDRGRLDDTIEALNTRSSVQSSDREPVLEYYKSQGKLVEINGELSIEEVSKQIRENLNLYG